jgi:hypothetical protein
MRHEFDATSFGAGVVFALLGLLFLADGLDAVNLDVRWVAPILLIGLGVAGLASTIRSARLDR